jgi:hypothetical protein
MSLELRLGQVGNLPISTARVIIAEEFPKFFPKG